MKNWFNKLWARQAQHHPIHPASYPMGKPMWTMTQLTAGKVPWVSYITMLAYWLHRIYLYISEYIPRLSLVLDEITSIYRISRIQKLPLDLSKLRTRRVRRLQLRISLNLGIVLIFLHKILIRHNLQFHKKETNNSYWTVLEQSVLLIQVGWSPHRESYEQRCIYILSAKSKYNNR